MTKILVIENEASLREEVLEILHLEHFQAVGAENGQLGVRLAREQRPDLILCDVNMPELDGYGVLKLLRAEPETATLPFVFLTGRAEKTDLRHGMTLGADDYLIKPFTRRDLLEAIAIRFHKQAAINRQTQKQLDQLCHNITLALPHELHTPLAGIIGMTELLIGEYDLLSSTELLEMLQTIQTSAERLYHLTQNFLLYAKLELMSANPQRFAVSCDQASETESHSAIKTVAQRKATQAGRMTDLQLELQDVVVSIAESQLQKIAEEIIDNAFKFSAPGTAVRVSSCFASGTFCLRVTDQGRGMTLEQISHVGAYMQFDRRSYEQQGLGMGLVIAKRLVEMQGGKLAIESIPNQGTSVQIMFS
jgi:two-component system, sensor histidine kinase and response regulator